MHNDAPITDLLAKWSRGDHEAFGELADVTYLELRRIARQWMVHERRNHTLDPTALAHEVYLRLSALKEVGFESRKPFFRLIGRLMRNVLVEHARAAAAQKRGRGVEFVPLDLVDPSEESRTLDALVLEETLQALEVRDEVLVRVIELRFLVGLTERQTADVLGLTRSTLQREWRAAKRVLAQTFDRRVDAP